MKIKELKENTNASVENVRVVEVGTARTFNKFGKDNRVCSAVIEDSSGKCKLSLFNEDVELVKKGQVLNIINGYVKEYKGELQISRGRNGQIEIVQSPKTI